jgi:hypothetical protein
MEQAVKAALALVGDPARRETMAEAAQGFAAANRGAAQRTATAVLAVVEAAAARHDDDSPDGSTAPALEPVMPDRTASSASTASNPSAAPAAAPAPGRATATSSGERPEPWLD